MCLTQEKDALLIEIPLTREPTVHSEILLIQSKFLKGMQKTQPHINVLLKPVQPNTTTENLNLLIYGDT